MNKEKADWPKNSPLGDGGKVGCSPPSPKGGAKGRALKIGPVIENGRQQIVIIKH